MGERTGGLRLRIWTGGLLSIGICSLLRRDSGWGAHMCWGILGCHGRSDFGIISGLNVITTNGSEISLSYVLGPNGSMSTQVLSESQEDKSNVVKHHYFFVKIIIILGIRTEDIQMIQVKNPNAVMAEASLHVASTIGAKKTVT